MSKHLKHILSVAAILCMVVFMRCANQLAPQGGPRDSLPPVVKLITPANGTRHFTATRIFVETDEYIQLKDINKEVFTSPLMKAKPAIVARGKGFRVDIKDTLLPDQTYAIDFGSAIRDNHEGNPLVGFRLVFSTGAAIDSMIVTGYAADAMKGDSISKAFIYFYDAALDTIPEYDSLLLTHKPDKVGRTEGNGIFIAQNLKDIPYKVYAIQDNNGNQRYDPGLDKVGFLDSIVDPATLESVAIWLDEYRHYPTADPQLYFRMFAETPVKRQNLASSERPGKYQAILRFGAPFPRIDTLAFEGIPEERVIREYMTAGRDTISLWFDMPPEALGDTIKGHISYLKTDSLGVLAPASQPLKLAWRYVESKEEQKEREKEEKERERAEKDGEEYTPPVKPNPFRFKVDAGVEINPEKNIPIEFDLPLVEVDSARISLSSISDLGDPAPVPFRVVRDTMNIRRWVIMADWNEQHSYRLSVPAGVFVNVAGERNDSLGANFNILPRSDFSTFVVKVVGKTPSAKYMVEVVDDKGRTIKELKDVSTGLYHIYYIPEGDVRLRVTEDSNGNGKWDSGSLVERRQPERVEFYVGPTGDQFIPARADWEADIDLDMVRIFAPVSMEKVRRDLQRAEDVREAKYLEDKAKRDAERKKRESGGVDSGGIGIGSALGGAKQQIQSTMR